MRLVFMGTPDFAVPALRVLLRDGHEIVSVVTPPDRPRRRQSSPPGPSPVKAESVRLGLPVLQPVSAKDPDFASRLAVLTPETIVVVAYGQIVPPEVLAVPRRWCINLHASILPKYRGAAPIARAILAGERITGVTTMKMDRGLDTGDILLQKECAIGLDETTGELAARLAELGAGLLSETLEQHARRALEPKRQDTREATLAPPLTREDGRIEWSQGALEIANRIRACNPWPLAWSHIGRLPIKILRAEPSFEPVPSGAEGGATGQIVLASAGRIVVRCRGDSRLALLQMVFPGRKPMTAREAINGRLIRAGDHLAPEPSG